MLADIHNSIIRDNIEGNRLIETSEPIRKIIDTREFQRLRSIHQTGLTSYVFPGSEHSRFGHSLGVYATAKLAFKQLHRRALPLDFETPGMNFDDHAELEFCVAALCHDIGHSAFSHVLETILLPDGIRNHELCTRAILTGGSEIAEVVRAECDRDAVLNLLAKEHANKALGDLISSTFDVDRCDYILRDSHMAGVEYGKYDLKWLLHAITVDKNRLGQPVLLLDGPRGLDALRQFLSARRYLHRQVYFHPAVRGAQLLLKAIFSRLQDVGPDEDTERLAPKCLHPLAEGRRLSMEDFIRATDIEIAYMIKNFAEAHSDKVLKLLSRLFVERKFPKCAFDSAKSNDGASKKYRPVPGSDAAAGAQGVLMEEWLPPTLKTITDDLRGFIENRLDASGAPREAAAYLVAFDSAPFHSSPPTDLLFSFRAGVVPFELIDPACVGFDIRGLLETFSIDRIYVPREFVSEARAYVSTEYNLK